MAPGDGLAVAAIAQTILDALTAHFDAAPGVVLPARRFIPPGSPRSVAWDTEGLAVTMASIGFGSAPGQNAAPQRTGNPISAAGMRHAVYACQLVRCVPESQDGVRAPDPAELTKAGLSLMRDAGLLSQALVEIATPVRSTLGPGGSVIVGAVEILGPEGGFACVEGSLTCTAGTLV